ncbi:MAG TPA: hypothetical protein VLJ37_07545 [bacterium]|nr:hypothetical protein [bacterium]
MSTNQVNPVNVSIQTLTQKDIEKQDKDAQKNRAQTAFDVPGDSIDVKLPQNATVATAAEGKAPTNQSGHHRLKAASKRLETALKQAGVDVKPNDSLVEKAQATLDTLDAKITSLLEKGGKEGELAQFERQRDHIIENLGALEAVQSEVAAETVGVQSANESAGTDGAAPEARPEEIAALWNDLDKEFKTIGLDVKGKNDVDLVKNQATALFSKKLEAVKVKETELKARLDGLQEQLKTAASPADKKRIEAEIKTAAADLKAILVQKADLQVSYLKINDAIMHFQAAKELGVEYDNNKKVETKSATVQTSSAKKEAPAPSGPVTTRSAKTASAPGAGAGGGVTLNTASAGGSSYTQGPQGADGGVTLGTASAEDAGAPVTGNTNVLHTSAMNDFSGTTLAIASTSNALRSDARRTDEAIKKLLRAAASGNYEAIKTALIMLDKRASQIVIGMGSATIKAMQNYEKQMGALSKSLDTLKTNDPSYNAKLAQVNSQMNIYSMNRQAIANFLQQTLTSREEIGNTTKGFISKDGQIGSAMSRW